MKLTFLLIVGLCINVTMQAQTTKTTNSNTNGPTSGQTPKELNTKDKQAAGKNFEIRNAGVANDVNPFLVELQSAVNGNPQQLVSFLNQPSIDRRLMSLTEKDKVTAKNILAELEHKIMSVPGPNPEPPIHSGTNIVNSGQTTMLMEKVRQLNQLLSVNHSASSANEQILSDQNKPAGEHANVDRNFEASRMVSEKQIVSEMENYRNELFTRVISEEYFRLMNDKTPSATLNNIQDRYSKLAKYRTLKELLQEQQSRNVQAPVPNNGQISEPMRNSMDISGMMKQLDEKIREEEMKTEMLNRQRMEMERRMEMDRQNQLQMEKK